MELDDLITYFTGTRLNGRGFIAHCPAHDDKTPSLTVARGETGWLVKCYTGCSFFDVVAAAGLQPLNLKFGGASSASSSISSPFAARRKLAELIQLKRRIPYKLDEIADITLKPEDRHLASAGAKYPDLMKLPLPDALRMHFIVMDGPVFEIIGGQWDSWGADWTQAKRNIARALWDTYRRERSSLVVGV